MEIYIAHVTLADGTINERVTPAWINPSWQKHAPSVLKIIDFSRFMNHVLSLHVNLDPQNQPSMHSCIDSYPISK